MSIPWSSLYCPSSNAEMIALSLQESLTALGYELYNPFSMMPGKAYRQLVKFFVAPAVDAWVRVIGEPDGRQLAGVSQTIPVLFVTLDAAEAQIQVYANGERAAEESALIPYLREGRTADELRQILVGDSGLTSPGTFRESRPQEPSSDLPFSALPKDVQAMADGVNPAQAQKLFSRLSGDVLKKFSGDNAQVEAARALVSGGTVPDWNSPGGQQIRALMACLTVPENWREPDFLAVRDAYPLYERRQRNPKARLYPGDEATMAQVPNALEYVPVYGGLN